jgi:hypothetical protein
MQRTEFATELKFLNDFWRFDIKTMDVSMEQIEVCAPKTERQDRQTVAYPGPRIHGATWSETGSLWLFGGVGRRASVGKAFCSIDIYDDDDVIGLCDMWQYPATTSLSSGVVFGDEDEGWALITACDRDLKPLSMAGLVPQSSAGMIANADQALQPTGGILTTTWVDEDGGSLLNMYGGVTESLANCSAAMWSFSPREYEWRIGVSGSNLVQTAHSFQANLVPPVCGAYATTELAFDGAESAVVVIGGWVGAASGECEAWPRAQENSAGESYTVASLIHADAPPDALTDDPSPLVTISGGPGKLGGSLWRYDGRHNDSDVIDGPHDLLKAGARSPEAASSSQVLATCASWVPWLNRGDHGVQEQFSPLYFADVELIPP